MVPEVFAVTVSFPEVQAPGQARKQRKQKQQQQEEVPKHRDEQDD